MIENLITIIAVGWFISNFSNDNFRKINGIVGKIIKCQKCATFWFGVIFCLITNSPWVLPFIASYIAFFLNNKINKINL